MVLIVSTDNNHNNFIGFVGNRVSDDDLTAILVTKINWNWRRTNNIPVDTTDVEAHFSDPNNRLKIFPVPTGLVGAELHHPGAPILPEALVDFEVEEQCTPWEVRKILRQYRRNGIKPQKTQQSQ